MWAWASPPPWHCFSITFLVWISPPSFCLWFNITFHLFYSLFIFHIRSLLTQYTRRVRMPLKCAVMRATFVLSPSHVAWECFCPFMYGCERTHRRASTRCTCYCLSHGSSPIRLRDVFLQRIKRTTSYFHDVVHNLNVISSRRRSYARFIINSIAIWRGFLMSCKSSTDV